MNPKLEKPSAQEAKNSIHRVGRQYNQWVADQTLEDFALRFTARKARHMSIRVVGTTALGATAFLALESLAAAVTFGYGTVNAVAAILAVAIIFFITGFPISRYSAKYGLDIDLLTRGAGFGYLGSTITSLIYATFTFIFFAIEASILSSALHFLFGIPMSLAYVICALVVIPIVMRGITAISKFQVGTQALWLALQLAALVVVLVFDWREFNSWASYTPEHLPDAHRFNWLYFGAASSVLFALIAQIGEQVDYLRFMPEKTEKNKRQWWFWLVLAGPGWVFIGVAKMLLGSFLAHSALMKGVPILEAGDPTKMYQRVFEYFVYSERIALILAAVMVIISQMKINLTNAYAGSIAWSNFFSRLTHTHPGRVVWLVFNVMLALLLMELGVHKVLESILSVFAFVAVSWLCCVSADLLINKPLGLSPKHIEFRRGYLFDINPVGFVSMFVAAFVGFAFYMGWFGEPVRTLGHFATIIVCFVMVPLLAWLTKGKYYLARQPEDLSQPSCQCGVCENTFEKEDMLFCPAYQSHICSLCCSLDSRCLDQCKDTSSGFTPLLVIVPRYIRNLLLGWTGRFFAWFIVVNAAMAALLSLVYQHMTLQSQRELPYLENGLLTLFFILMIINGVVIWLFLLAHESRKNAQQESNQQTKKLMQEIQAHELTDAALQNAKELAENASAAKSRYLSGISHELRTPLQSILGYTQLLKERQDTPSTHQKSLDSIHRGGQYLSDLIEGLLDVSKIEAGKLELHQTVVNFPELVYQISEMFHMKAAAKGLPFNLNVQDVLPGWVKTDEKRLRQVLINLLSNAIKYTDKGAVDFEIRYRTQVAEFIVRDTGCGIPADQHERIFSPFERIQRDDSKSVSGTGLGLTIVKLLVEVMGGDLQLKSELNKGSEFKVSLMLPWVQGDIHELDNQESIVGYQADKKSIFIIDDDTYVREMLTDLLQPLGFDIHCAENGRDCLNRLDQLSSDLFIIDVSMPGMNGFELAKELRLQRVSQPILMLSANAQVPPENFKKQYGYSDYLIKPIRNQALLDAISFHLNISWQTTAKSLSNLQAKHSRRPIQIVDSPELAELISASEIGFKRGILEALKTLRTKALISEEQFARLSDHAESMQFNRIKEDIEVI
ncbi:hybrid sensor histidine kinase/response regulator [Reinekea thalattae]|uniref:histidine kinase n=1 Tax=Reinekea thalattae TaxID=2593301 RepID=A0A5C8Z5Y8_9GAMM|nr:ATP-binding protein [Reinekea thalattae]TXR53382.1 response regulator [Reinekea thalattae]